ncbi:hypothetical protein A3A84_03250 [Candidatus Collierbacteria bacterium RIFCSPLOWO2_01_FULL_50_23]|uniref:Uncharacterized protein n=2 Tax=Candidatus Collieribacteriota TaxID=1752725 RepID=A0A1F5EWI1_9BACT|nr:MAG: hypothetical protein A3D09_03080 [Candidatus Collierbacteria bacterium RIFCSPHIGHO2_02_FULL_49_10]OGD71945.1 MAG: hypothetical protein A2703_01005 [Candidatus Collierbacteria bacterium RIFCSPHIGHO2_01_FULL_50_25]OGD74809.1 MAG: hypothetical protein A3A84_03250 [Candidatus Collierbacteria bacterium RIFCSPLOWO2_01_FULL_50_23]
MKSEKGRSIHQQALDAQEEGKFPEALKLEDEAMIVYQEEGDEAGFAEIQSMRTLTYRHLYDSTGFAGYLIKAKHEAEAGLDLAERSGNESAIAIPLVGVARILYDLGEYSQAAENFGRAVKILESHPEESHSRKSVIADFSVHMFVSQYRAGDKSALSAAEEALDELANTADASPYEKEVWLSGGHMKIAEAVNEADHNMAMDHMNLAKKIIDGDEKLKLRLEQWNKLMAKLKG